MIKFYNTKDQLDKNQIVNLETKLQFKFPKEYKAHLLQFNGGRCYPNTFLFEEDGEMTSSVIDWFLPIEDDNPNSLFKCFKDLKITEKRMPNTVFPIAYDTFGNHICLDTIDGKIYFWDHELVVDYTISDDSDRSNLYFIANSLKEFLMNLTPCELYYPSAP